MPIGLAELIAQGMVAIRLGLPKMPGDNMKPSTILDRGRTIDRAFVAAMFLAWLAACGGVATSSPEGIAGTGGTSTGGTSTGGTSTGGTSTGGTSTGGTSTGGPSTGGTSTGGTSTGGTSTGGTSTGGSSTGGTSTGGTSTGGSSTGGSACVPKDPGTGGSFEYTCADLSVLTVSDPAVIDNSGDGLVSAGEGAMIKAMLNEVAGIGFGMYPGVYFESSDVGVTVKEDDWYYGIGACQTLPVTAHATFASNIPSGSIVTITARVGMIGQPCPDAYEIAIPITVH